MEEEEVEAAGVGADKLGERPVEGSAAADGGVRVALERRFVHRHHHPRRRRRIRHCNALTHASLARAAFLGKKKRSFGGNLSRGQKAAGLCYFFLLAPINFARSTLSINKTICILWKSRSQPSTFPTFAIFRVIFFYFLIPEKVY
jgi:hypothetical protein